MGWSHHGYFNSYECKECVYETALSNRDNVYKWRQFQTPVLGVFSVGKYGFQVGEHLVLVYNLVVFFNVCISYLYLFIEKSLLSYNTSQLQSSASTPHTSPYLPSHLEPLLLCFLFRKNRSLRDERWQPKSDKTKYNRTRQKPSDQAGQGNSTEGKVLREQAKRARDPHSLLGVSQNTELIVMTYMQRTSCRHMQAQCLLFQSLWAHVSPA